MMKETEGLKRAPHGAAAWCLLVLFSLVLPAFASEKVVDFRYALPWWQSTVNMPDDPEKPLLGKEGQFFFDFGGGGPRQFRFSIAPVITNAVWQKQETVTAKTPIIQTEWKDGQVDIRTDGFIAIPQDDEMKFQLERVGGEIAIAGWDGPKGKRHQARWVKPVEPCDKSFVSIALGQKGQPIAYRLQVKNDKPVTLVFGYCEGYWDAAGQRVMKLSVEGGASKVIDPCKDFGKNSPGLYKLEGRDSNHDGVVDIRVVGDKSTVDNNIVLNALWAFEGDVPDDASILSGKENDNALAFANCGSKRVCVRRCVSIINLTNNGDEVVTRTVRVEINGKTKPKYKKDQNVVIVAANTHLQASEAIAALSQKGEICTVELAPVEIPAGQTRSVVLTIHRHEQAPFKAYTTDSAKAEYARAWNWWESEVDLPWDTIQVPDSGIQGMLHSCVRNIWQSRDIKRDLPAFHVGPTFYRCMWIVDGAFMLETAAILGRAEDARAGIDYMLSFQEADGGFQLKKRYWKEGGLVMWSTIRNAMLTNDKTWLEERWPRIERAFAWLQSLRKREGAANPDSPEYRLLPWGDIDGGINNCAHWQKKGEYSNVYWSLIGMKTAVQAATWLGKTELATEWQKEYDDFDASFRKAAKRDLRPDESGNMYLPIIMEDALKALPQRAQWSFCHAVYPGQLFAADDPIATGTLDMLKETEVQGLVYGTGWDVSGIWNYFASFYGHALLWRGEGQKAAQVLYDFANHAVPTRVWREEQKPVGEGSGEVGDMPHNWASAEFIRLTAHLLALDRGSELHLFEGLLKEWTKPGHVTKLNKLLTPFGPLTLELKVSPDGKTATLDVEPLTYGTCEKIVVHLGGWASKDAKAVFELNPKVANHKTIDITFTDRFAQTTQERIAAKKPRYDWRFDRKLGVARTGKASASSEAAAWSAANALDVRDAESRWAADPSVDTGAEWLCVDLGKTHTVGRVRIQWERAYAKGYKLQLSDDGKRWADAVVIDDGDGGVDNVTFAAAKGRYVRMQCTKRGAQWPCSIHTFGVFEK